MGLRYDHKTFSYLMRKDSKESIFTPFFHLSSHRSQFPPPADKTAHAQEEKGMQGVNLGPDSFPCLALAFFPIESLIKAAKFLMVFS